MKPTPAELRALARRDPALGRAMKRLEPYPGFPTDEYRRRTPYESIARAIVFQQLAGAAASTIHGRVCKLTPGPRFPTAAELLALPDETLRSAGLSRGKLSALRDLATHVENGSLDFRRLVRAPDETVVEALTAVRGIGPWTARMFLLFRLGRLDVFAPDDLGLREGARLLDGLAERPTPKELEARAESWRPLRSVASWYLWRLVDSAKKTE